MAMLANRSKTDTWRVAALAIVIAASLFAAIKVLAAASLLAWVVALLTVIIGAGLPLWLLLSTRHTLGGGYVVVHGGPFTRRIPVADLTRVAPSNDPRSSPALSLDRLRMDCGRGRSIMILPRNTECSLRTSSAPVVARTDDPFDPPHGRCARRSGGGRFFGPWGLSWVTA